MFARNSLIGLLVALALSAGYAWLNSKLLSNKRTPPADQPQIDLPTDRPFRWRRDTLPKNFNEADDGPSRESVVSSDGCNCD